MNGWYWWYKKILTVSTPKDCKRPPGFLRQRQSWTTWNPSSSHWTTTMTRMIMIGAMLALISFNTRLSWNRTQVCNMTIHHLNHSATASESAVDVHIRLPVQQETQRYMAKSASCKWIQQMAALVQTSSEALSVHSFHVFARGRAVIPKCSLCLSSIIHKVSSPRLTHNVLSSTTVPTTVPSSNSIRPAILHD